MKKSELIKLIKEIQAFVGAEVDGDFGPISARAVKAKLLEQARQIDILHQTVDSLQARSMTDGAGLIEEDGLIRQR